MNESYFQAVCVDPSEYLGLEVGKVYRVQQTDPEWVFVEAILRYALATRFQRLQDEEAPTPAPAPAEAAVAPADGLAGTLAARGSRYGSFETNGRIAQDLKDVMRRAPNWGGLTGAQAEALDMFASKISRLLTGDPDYPDNWHDIAGYATLVEETLTK